MCLNILRSMHTLLAISCADATNLLNLPVVATKLKIKPYG